MGRFCFFPRILEFPQIWGNFVKKNRFSSFFHRIDRKPNRKNLWISSLYVTWFSWVTWGFSHSFFYDKNPFEKNPFPQIWRNSLQLKFFISPNLGKFPQIWGQPDCLCFAYTGLLRFVACLFGYLNWGTLFTQLWSLQWKQ